MTETTRTALLLCGDWRLSVRLADWSPDGDVEVHVVPGLCGQLETIGRVLTGKGFHRLVLGLCSEEYSVAEMQTQARKLGLDALGVEIVHLRDVEVEKAKVLLTAAVARARVFAGSRPEHAKLYLSSRISRRSLLRLSITEYMAAPSIDHGLCAADIGCSVCAQVCPQNALEWADGRMHYDKEKCEPCGLCVTSCPRGAVLNPACTPAQLEAQVRTLLSVQYRGPRGILFLCQRSPEPGGTDGWMPVRLPCVGMATPTWLLAPLLMGAGSVTVVPCGEACPAHQADAVEEKVAFCRQYLRMIGAPEDLVTLSPAPDESPRHGGDGVSPENPFSHRAGADVLLSLAQAYGVTHGVLEHPAAPVGSVEIRAEACTACGMCARSCPTEALTFGEGEEGVTLNFDASRCVACSQCLPKCPEMERGAITLHRMVDLERLDQGRTLLYGEETARCVVCGAAIAPLKMVKRVEELLGTDYAAMMPLLTQYCMDCRVTSQG